MANSQYSRRPLISSALIAAWTTMISHNTYVLHPVNSFGLVAMPHLRHVPECCTGALYAADGMINGDDVSSSGAPHITMDQLMPDDSKAEALKNAVDATILIDEAAADEDLLSLVSSEISASLSSSSSLAEPRLASELSEILPEHPFAPPLTYGKYLTMQSKRVMVSVRYSAESGLKPYFLTVAKRVKDTFPDVLLERVILPKVEVGESGFDAKSAFAGSIFEVLVDGKVVVRTAPGRKGVQSNEMAVFVSMEELDAAISRARKRRRPSSVYGEGDDLEDEKSRLQVLKEKAYEINSRNAGKSD